MTGFIYAPVDVQMAKDGNDSGIFTRVGGFAVADYMSYVPVFNANELTKSDYIVGAIVEETDDDMDILQFINIAINNPSVKIIILQKPNNSDLVKWETYLGRKCGWKNLHSYDMRIAFGRFLNKDGNMLKAEIVGKE